MARRRWRVFLAVAIATATSAGCSSDDDGGDEGDAPAAAPVRSTPLSSREIARFPLRGEPDWLAADDRYLYVKQDSGTVTAIDPQQNAIAWETMVTSDLCQGLGVGFGAVWTCAPNDESGTDDVVRLDVQTHQVVATLPVGKDESQGHIVTGFGRVWIMTTTPEGSSLVGIDPSSHAPDPPIALGVIAADLAIDDRFVWATSPSAGEVVAVDPGRREVVHRVKGLSRLRGPSQLAAGPMVWVGGDEATAGIDPDSGKVAVDVSLGAGRGLAASEDDLWIHGDDPFLTKLDAASGEVRERILEPALTDGGDVLVAFGSVWVSASDDGVLVRLRP